MRISWIELGKLAASSIPYQTEDILSVHEQGIRAILTLTEHPLTTYKHLTPDFFEGLDIRYFHVGIPDQEGPTVKQADQIIEIINEMHNQNRPILVHCHAGIGRTGTTLYLYYLAQGMTMEQARAEIYSARRQCVSISDDQITSLNNFTEARKNRQAS